MPNVAPALTVENVIQFLNGINNLGESMECLAKSSKRIVLKTDKNRKETLELVANLCNVMWGAEWKKDMKSVSSEGAVVIDGKIVIAVKPLKFNPVHYEEENIYSLNKQMERIKEQYGTDCVLIQDYDYKTIHKITRCTKTQGTPKSDFMLLDLDDKPVIWISHKDAKSGGPKDFQQWGGITETAGPNIYNHPEVVAFRNTLKKIYPVEVPPSTSLYRKIQDENLKMLSIYGPDYGKSTGADNVSFLAQGSLLLKETSNNINGTPVFELTASAHIIPNGKKLTGEWEGVLFVRSGGAGRNNFGIRNCRVGICPRESRSWHGTI